MDMTIVIYIVLFLGSATAQPSELVLNIKQPDNNNPQAFINASEETRDIPIPMGETVEFLCNPTGTVDSNPWIFVVNNSAVPFIVNDVESTQLQVFSYENDLGIWILRVQDFTSNIEGAYECRSGNLVESINLIEGNPGVVVANTVEVHPKGSSGVNIETATLGSPNPYPNNVNWYKDGVPIENSPDDYTVVDNRLFIVELEYKHSGIYTVVVENSQGTANSSTLLIVTGPPVINLSTSTDKVYIGDTFELVCNVTEGHPNSDIAWYFDDTLINPTEQDELSIVTSSSLSTLTVTNAQGSHQGIYKCSANNSIDTISKIQDIVIYLPSPSKPVIVITSSSDNFTYAGSEISLKCMTSLADDIHKNKNVKVTWKLNGELFDISASDRHSVTEEETSALYTSLLTLHPASSLADSGNYSCTVRIHNNSVSSDDITSDIATLNVIVPSIQASLTPQTIDIIDFSPYNSIRLNCSVSLPTGINANISFQWPHHSTDSLSILHEDRSSELAGGVNTAGTYQYTCALTILLSPPDSPLLQNVSATVNVQGPTSPHSPVISSSQVKSYNSVGIKFTIQEISYSQETYYVLYGKSSDNLSLRSATLQGNGNLSTLNEEYEISLSHLDDNSVYYYTIVADNGNGLSMTPVKSFQTPKIALAQFKAGPFRGCNVGRVQDFTSVENFFNEKLSEIISVNCDCSFPRENLINGTLQCTTVNNILNYRVNIIPIDDLSSTQVLEHLQEWVSSKPTLISGVAEISLDPNCEVAILSLDDPLCDGTEPTVNQSSECQNPLLDLNTLILIGVIGGTLFMLCIVVIVVLIIMLVFQHKRLKRISIRKTSNQYSVVNCKRETSFTDHHKKSPPAISVPTVPTQRQWEGDVSISDCPAYLYSVKPLDDDPTQTIVERQPTPGIYDSIDGLNNGGFHHIHQVPNPLTSIENCKDMDDCTGSSGDYS